MLEEKIQYRFKNRELLQEALTHSSYGYEKSCPFNERLEFLGDAILGYVISRELYLRHPDQPEGVLSKAKAQLVSARSLAKKAELLGLGGEIVLGKGETKAGGRKKSSILADAVEALIGAVHLDGGLEHSQKLILDMYHPELENPLLTKINYDYKTELQERLQERGLGLPQYKVVREEGPAHDRRFLIRAEVGSYQGPIAKGSSKKSAQQECAKFVLDDSEFWESTTKHSDQR